MKFLLRTPLLWGALAMACAAAAQAAPVVTPIAQARWRHELFDTLRNASPGQDKTYSYGGLRARGGVSLRNGPFEGRAVLQAVTAYEVPNDASFGSGRTLFALSDRDTSPSALDLIELTAGIKNDRLAVAVGRQGFKDLPETPTGNDRLDWLRKARLSERLVGTWEWTLLGRRFDGAGGAFTGKRWDAHAYLGRVLQGGFDVDDGFQPLDDVNVAGASLGTFKARRLPHSDIRLFTVIYRDDRDIVKASAGGDIAIDTLGASLATVVPLSRGSLDFLVWTAVQRGDYGSMRHRAGAYALEAGYGDPQARFSPWLRAGINHAGGDGDSGDNRHETFFNVLPTNHKFYGIQDLNAFQNLLDTFIQVRLKPAARWSAEATAHAFRLSEKQDAWYGGSGAASDEALGFDARRPAGGNSSRNIGAEFDAVVGWQALKRLGVEAGISRFQGGSAAKKIFPSQSDATFAYLQANFQY
jgi:hypothetical protein